MTTLDPEIDRLLAILDRADPPAVLDNVEALAEALRGLRKERAVGEAAEQYWQRQHAAARTDIPALVAEVRRLREALGEPAPFEED